MDAGVDGGGDAGPTRCESTADCVTAGLMDFVCDPTELSCRPKCTTDSECLHVSEGRCEKVDGVCRTSCTLTDYCPDLDAGVVCDDDKGSCIKRCAQDDDCSALGKLGTRYAEATAKCNVAVHGCNFDTDCNNFLEFDDY